MSGENYYIGVDVGTGSARAAMVKEDGCIVAMATEEIQIWNPEPNMYEQSSDNIWACVVSCVRKILSEKKIKKSNVSGIGFDATCSLVVLDKDFKPVSISQSGNDCCNIMMWMDHRAGDEANQINQTKHGVLKHCGGNVSLEMEPPKLLWLKKNLGEQCWTKAAHFLELPDFLTWRSTGSLSRSLCSVGCKWLFEPGSNGVSSWNDSFFKQIGLEDLLENNYSKIGNGILPGGAPCGDGLSQRAAEELGLLPGTPVGTSLLDAHAGVIGCLSCKTEVVSGHMTPLTNRMALICGTSSCHMTLSNVPRYVTGVWGPFYSAILPQLWNNEGGQSAAGKLLDHVVQTHSAYSEVVTMANTRSVSVYEILNENLNEVANLSALTSVAMITKDLHVWPDFHGNRSPLADATLTGMICGLTLSSNKEDLAKLYLATLQAIAYGTRHILEELQKQGQITEALYLCGGLVKNPLFVQTHADVTGLPVVLPDERESVLLGSAILGACASRNYVSLQAAMEAMGGNGKLIQPNTADVSYHNKKYAVFRRMVEDQQAYRKIMMG